MRLENERDREQTMLLIKVLLLAGTIVGAAALLQSYFGARTAGLVDKEL